MKKIQNKLTKIIMVKEITPPPKKKTHTHTQVTSVNTFFLLDLSCSKKKKK